MTAAARPRIRLTFLGTGTSIGVPMPGCDCPVCRSVDARDSRWRASVLVEWEGAVIVIDTTPEFRLQMLRANVKRIDAVLYTHNHADHVHGLDDVRAFNFSLRREIPIHGSRATLDWVREHFAYIWNPVQRGGGIPRITLHPFDGPFELRGLTVTPLAVMHGKLAIHGFRFGDVAYISDVSAIPDATRPLLEGLDVLVLDAVRYTPHETHMNVEQAIAEARRIGARQTFFTHMNHEIAYARLAAELPAGMAPAYDGLVVES